MKSEPPGLLRRVLGRGLKLAHRAKERVGASPGLPPGTPVPVSFGAAGGGEAPTGWSLLAAARALDVDIDHFCGGNSSCGTCRVIVKSGGGNLSPMQPNERLVLGVGAEGGRHRLACQARIQGPVEVEVPEFFMVR